MCGSAAICSCPCSYLFMLAQLSVHVRTTIYLLRCDCVFSRLRVRTRRPVTTYSRDFVYMPTRMTIFFSSLLQSVSLFFTHFPIFIFPTPFYPSASIILQHPALSISQRQNAVIQSVISKKADGYFCIHQPFSSLISLYFSGFNQKNDGMTDKRGSEK